MYWREYLMFGMFYFTMEVFQTMQWLYGNVYTLSDSLNQDTDLCQFRNQGIKSCDRVNTYYTVVAHILIWSQPILFSYIGYRTSDSSKKFIVGYLGCILSFFDNVIYWIYRTRLLWY